MTLSLQKEKEKKKEEEEGSKDYREKTQKISRFIVLLNKTLSALVERNVLHCFENLF